MAGKDSSPLWLGVLVCLGAIFMASPRSLPKITQKPATAVAVGSAAVYSVTDATASLQDFIPQLF